jgi:hypothetical protein
MHRGCGLSSCPRFQDHRQVSVQELFRGWVFNRGDFGEIFNCSLEEIEAIFRTTHLAHSEHDRELDVSSIREERPGSPYLGFKVVIADVGAKFDLFGFHRVLFPFRRFGFLVALEDEPAVIHDLANGGAGVRRNLDQIEPILPGQVASFVDGDDADLLTVGVNNPYRRVSDAVVDAMFRLRRRFSK